MRGARPALLLAALLPLLSTTSAHGQVETVRRVIVVELGPPVSLEDALRHPALARMAQRGGAGLLALTDSPSGVRRRLAMVADQTISAPAGKVRHSITAAIRKLPGADEFLIVTYGAEPSDAMVARGDVVTPLVLARGTRQELFSPGGTVRGLSSDTTGRPGLVSNVDLVPTVLAFLGRPIPSDSAGNRIRVEGSPPIALHQTYLQYRRVVTPVGLAVLGLALVALAAGLAIVLGAWRPSPGVVRGVAFAGLFAAALHVALLPGSWLPDYSWPVVVATLAAVGALVTALAVWAGRRSPYAAAATVAGVGAALVVVDAALGWRSLLTPLVGGSALEGARFYGLGNSYAGLLVAGLVLVAALLRPWAGVALLVAGALFAGAPWTGADLGGGLTLFGAAAIWWALAVRRRFGFPEAAVVVGAVAAGAVVLVLLHRTVAEPSHVARAVTDAGGVEGIAATFLDRLRLNLETTARTPAIWPALAGVVVATVAAWRRWGPLEPAFQGHPLWRPAVLTLGTAAILGYVLNDTYGLAGVAFVYLALALLYPALEKMFGRNGKKA